MFAHKETDDGEQMYCGLWQECELGHYNTQVIRPLQVERLKFHLLLLGGTVERTN